MKYAAYALAGLLSLAACNTPVSQTTTTTTPPAPTPPLAAEVPVASSPGSSYGLFRGQLPGQADSVMLHLITARQPHYDNRGLTILGSYYGPDGHPYPLGSGAGSSPADSIVLHDYTPEHGPTPGGEGPIWRLRRQADGSLAGTVGGRATRLRPVAAPAGSLSFVVRCFADSLAALPQQARSPQARFFLQALEPVGGPAAVRQALQAGIGRELRGDTLGTLPPLALPALFAQQRAAFFNDYRADAADVKAPTDTADLGSFRASLNYEQQAQTYVLYQQQSLLSLAFFSYVYTGGAHGSNGTTAASYDLRTGRRLRYANIFRPEAARQLPALLAQAVRPLVGLAPGAPLEERLFVKKMPVTHNVFLTAGGVGFIYQPYEIASYAQGEVWVFLPLRQVRALLREGLPLPAGAGMAAR
ncbi:DUF3298 and DUF4163 domain-containing protein [Hymenobacter psoromatis]|uniref:DUF3298 and DUF4163 domain-containing protein n=1 Tax=Hymenobacter psoromatis TaxID=1484116 RepID=UPI001CBB1163|nr:DUF3298 and DUF4163 domain-containing protein [Hymenobacter psoromatis]